MPNCKPAVPSPGTPEQEERLRKVIEEHKGQPGATMPVLQAAQEIVGYLPEEVQIMVAEGLDIPLSEVYGVSTFYSFFTLNPKGKYQISVCLGTACYVKGAAPSTPPPTCGPRWRNSWASPLAASRRTGCSLWMPAGASAHAVWPRS